MAKVIERCNGLWQFNLSQFKILDWTLYTWPDTNVYKGNLEIYMCIQTII